MARQAVYLNVDISDATSKIKELQAAHTEEQFTKLMYNAFKRTGAKVKTIMRQDLPKKYDVKPSWVGSQVGAPKTSMGGGGVNCSIPIDGKRGTIGGTYKATGGAHGWNALRRKRYKITAQMVKSGSSTMPKEMHNQGGNPPFRNLGSKLGKLAFTRKTKARFPIARVVGIGVPQMPMNRSQGEVQKDIMDVLMKRLEHEHAYLISKCR